MLNSESIEQLKDLRREFHAHPEISENEFETQKRILKFLAEETSAQVKKVGFTGVLASFKSNQPGPVIMVRGDIDALPIAEVNTFAHRSTSEGVSHKCGHDGHTTILLGLAKLLSAESLESGSVHLLFQPAEENGMGAQNVLNEAVFKDLKIDFAFALHNLPGYEKHEIVVKDHEFTGNVKSIIIKLQGKTSHAAEPEQGINPGLAMANLLRFADDMTNNFPEKDDFFLMTPVYANLGDLAYGISAGYGEVHFTIRSWNVELMKTRSAEIVHFVNETCKAHSLTPEISWTQVFYANVNHPEAVDFIRMAAKKADLKLSERQYPFKWGEDFGLFTQQYKGAMFGLGAGLHTPALHNPDYDFPDDILKTGITLFYNIIKSIK